MPEGIADAGRLEGGGSRFRGAVSFFGLGVMAKRKLDAASRVSQAYLARVDAERLSQETSC